MNFPKTAILILPILAAYARAEIRTNELFSDNMMLRQNSARIWGTCEPNAKIKAQIGGLETDFAANGKGEWSAEIKTPKGSFEPLELRLSENGKLSKTIKNVLVGEVWIAGGQSNLDFKLANTDGAGKYIDGATPRSVRYFRQHATNRHMFSAAGLGSRPESGFAKGAEWVLPAPQNAAGLNAVPYIFAVERSAEIGMPVGIVYTGVPGTCMASWVSLETYENSDAFAEDRAARQKRIENYDYNKERKIFDENVKTYPARAAKAKAEGKTPPPAWTVAPFLAPWPDSPDMWWTPSMLFNLRVNPLRSYAASGIVWYQGEGDTGGDTFAENVSGGDAFAAKFECLIGEWRKHFGSPDLPFLFVQLPSFGASTDWTKARAAQERVARKLENTAMVCAIDTGDKYDIHPHDKIPIGKRLAAAADTIGKKIFPQVGGVGFDGSRATAQFETPNKIECRGNCRGFEILTNGKWRAAKADFDGGEVKIESENGERIDGVRYLYKNWAKPDACLFDQNGYPVPPFEIQR